MRQSCTVQLSGMGKIAFPPALTTYYTERYHENSNLKYCSSFKHQKDVQYKEDFYLCPKDYIHFDFKSITQRN